MLNVERVFWGLVLVASLAAVCLWVGCRTSPDGAAPGRDQEPAGSPTPLPTTDEPLTPALASPTVLHPTPRPTQVTPSLPSPTVLHPSPRVEETQASSSQPGPSPTPVWCEDEELLSGSVGVPLSSAYAPLPSHRDAALEEVIRNILGEDADGYGVVVKNLYDGAVAEVNPDKVFETASLFKLWVMYEVYKQVELGLVEMDEELLVTPYYASWDAGTLPVDICDTLTVREALRAMITYSDNTSGFLLRDRVGSSNINRDLQALGLTESGFGYEYVTSTAADMTLFLEMVTFGAAVSIEASQEMLDLMLAQQVRDRLPALLPPDAAVANKTGDLPEVTHDVGIVYSPQAMYVIVVLSEISSEPERIALVSNAVYDYFNR